jgi:uncharacterized RmlC-like cupin family protein
MKLSTVRPLQHPQGLTYAAGSSLAARVEVTGLVREVVVIAAAAAALEVELV